MWGNLIGIEFALGNNLQISLHYNTNFLIFGFDHKIDYFFDFGSFWWIELTSHLEGFVSVDEFYLAVGELIVVVEFYLHVVDEELVGL